MYLHNSTKPDFCIILEKNENDSSWYPVTSLNMDEVYCNIRIFGYFKCPKLVVIIITLKDIFRSVWACRVEKNSAFYRDWVLCV